MVNAIVLTKAAFLRSEDVLSGDEIDNGDNLKYWVLLVEFIRNPDNANELTQVA